jgi:hypothetical protein
MMKKSHILTLCIALAMIFTLANFNTVPAQQTVEDQYWNLIKNSKNLEDFEGYLKEYPKGKFAPLARLKIKLQSKGKPNTNNENFLITPTSVGDIKLGMTIADARKVFKDAKFEQYNYSEEGIWVEVTKGEKNLMRFTTDQKDVSEGDANGKVNINESSRIESIEFSDPRYKTADGIHVGITIVDAEKTFGNTTKIDFWGLDGSEHIEFANSPKNYSFTVSAKKGSGNDAKAGVYGEDEFTTKSYSTSAYINSMRISKFENSPDSGQAINYLLTPNSAGDIRAGMTVADVRKIGNGIKLTRTEGMDGVEALKVEQGSEQLMLIYPCTDIEGSRYNENSKIELIQTWNPGFRTAEGIHPNMKLSDLEKKYGKIKITQGEIGSPSAEFKNMPKMSFDVEGAIFKDGEKENEMPVTSSYAPDAKIHTIWVSINNCPKETDVETNGQNGVKILWDYRDFKEIERQKFSENERQTFFNYLFGNKWDKNLKINNRFSGSFTKPNAKETLYYVSACNAWVEDEKTKEFKETNEFTTDCAHAVWDTAGWIVIFNENNIPVMKVKAALGYTIAKMTDVNGDGISEILSLRTYSNQGYTMSGAALGHIVQGKYELILDLGGYSDSCSTGDENTGIAKAGVTSYVPTANGNMPKFSTEYFQGGCNNSEWKKITKQQFDGN